MSVRAAFLEQAGFCDRMGSPFTARLCRLLAERLEPGTPVADRVLGWAGAAGPRSDALPLRLAGALHGLVLEGRDQRLAEVYPPADADDEALWTEVVRALAGHPTFMLTRLDGPPQTNETQRTAALTPGMLTVAALTGLPLVTSELGASAGLNLYWDRFAYRFGEPTWGDPASPVLIAPAWDGPPPPLPAATVASRAGVDRAPVDVTDEASRLRLLSFVWADQLQRMSRLAAAIDIARASGVQLECADAVDWLARRLAVAHPGRAHVVYHSIFWQYLPAEAQDRARALLAAAGARASADAPFAWLRMEGDGAPPEDGAAITLTLWPSGETRPLGRVDFHGSWVRWAGW